MALKILYFIIFCYFMYYIVKFIIDLIKLIRKAVKDQIYILEKENKDNG